VGPFQESSAESLRRQISYFARSASVELTTKEILESTPYRRLLGPSTQVYIPHLPATRASDVIAAVRILVADGMVPVPHLAARRFKSDIELDNLVDQLGDAGCRQALVIGGGVARPAGPFVSALDVLCSGKLERAGIRRIGIAGHPEGSQDIEPQALKRAFLEKAQLAESGLFEMYLVSQFCFESVSIIAWEKELRNLGNRLPIHIGVPGVTSGAKLLRFAAICGVKASAGFMRQGTRILGRLLSRWMPSAIVMQLASASVSDPGSMIRQLHFFPFGGFPETVAWLKAVAEGHYDFADDEEGVQMVVEEERP